MLWGRIYIDEAHQRKSVNTHYMLIIKSNSSSNMLLVTSTPFEKGSKDLAGYIEAVQHREAWKSNLVTKDYTFDKLNTMQNDFQAVRRELKDGMADEEKITIAQKGMQSFETLLKRFMLQRKRTTKFGGVPILELLPLQLTTYISSSFIFPIFVTHRSLHSPATRYSV